MFTYNQPAMMRRFLMSKNTLKAYFYNGVASDFTATSTNNRTCEMLGYAMDQTYLESFLRNTTATAAGRLPLAAATYFTTAACGPAPGSLLASASTVCPAHGRGTSPASSTAPAGGDGLGRLTLAWSGPNAKPLPPADLPGGPPQYLVTSTRQALATAPGPEAAAALAVYPNPAHGTLHLAMTVPEAMVATATLLDALGREVFRQALELRAGLNHPALWLGALPSGTYQLVLKLAGGPMPYLTQKIVLE